jgi:hypothetical protein
MSQVLGILGNQVVIGPYYAGDGVHLATITDSTRQDLIERDVIVFESIDHINAYLYGVSIEDWNNRIANSQMPEPAITDTDSKLPF